MKHNHNLYRQSNSHSSTQHDCSCLRKGWKDCNRQYSNHCHKLKQIFHPGLQSLQNSSFQETGMPYHPPGTMNLPMSQIKRQMQEPEITSFKRSEFKAQCKIG